MMKQKIIPSIFIFIFISLPLKGHDFWLVPTFFNVPAGAVIQVEGLTHDIFPQSEIAVTVDRIADARVVGADTTLLTTKMSTIGTFFVCQTPRLNNGEWWIGIVIKPRRIDLTAKQFNEYLLHEGLDRIYQARKEKRIADQPAVERYSKYAKTFGGVGLIDENNVHNKTINHRIEFIPLNNPQKLDSGDTLTVQLLFEGKPLADEVVFAGHDRGDGAPHIRTTTDENGVVNIPINERGIWYVKTIYMQTLDDNPEFDYESWWTTMTFEIINDN